MIKIMLDPGHYGSYNRGIAEGYYESRQMLVLGNLLKTELTKKGFTPLLTRSGEEDIALAMRGKMAGAAEAEIFLSLHSNAPGKDEEGQYDPKVRGLYIYYSVRQPQNKALAEKLGQAAAMAMGTPFRGARVWESPKYPGQDYMTVLQSAVAAGVPVALLIEHGFHTNMEDCAALLQADILARIAAAEADVFSDTYLPAETSAPFRKGKINTPSGVAVRTLPDEDSPRSDGGAGMGIPNGTEIAVYQLIMGTDGTEWAKVFWHSAWGYCKAQYIEFAQTAVKVQATLSDQEKAEALVTRLKAEGIQAEIVS